MTGLRTFVLLHPYGTSDGFKRVYVGNDQGRVNRVVDGYRNAGWSREIFTVRATSMDDAMEQIVKAARP
jgi:hypothetical protein